MAVLFGGGQSQGPAIDNSAFFKKVPGSSGQFGVGTNSLHWKYPEVKAGEAPAKVPVFQMEDKDGHMSPDIITFVGIQNAGTESGNFEIIHVTRNGKPYKAEPTFMAQKEKAAQDQKKRGLLNLGLTGLEVAAAHEIGMGNIGPGIGAARTAGTISDAATIADAAQQAGGAIGVGGGVILGGGAYSVIPEKSRNSNDIASMSTTIPDPAPTPVSAASHAAAVAAATEVTCTVDDKFMGGAMTRLVFDSASGLPPVLVDPIYKGDGDSKQIVGYKDKAGRYVYSVPDEKGKCQKAYLGAPTVAQTTAR
jgi:hypothetical protein